jgi:hypothetical protein
LSCIERVSEKNGVFQTLVQLLLRGFGLLLEQMNLSCILLSSIAVACTTRLASRVTPGQ